MSAPVRVRFAPSPTGYLHVGGARTALFNYLFARHHGGTFILRIEDTDQNRIAPGALDEIYQSLRWLGLEWDEGPGKEGDCGPYIQSQRLDLYRKSAEQLLASGNAYRCFCTAERLDHVRKEQERLKTNLGYDKHCRSLSKEEESALLAQGKPFVVRLKVPAGRTITFNDMIRGPISYESDQLDDLVLLKTDKFPTYHLANVVDDHFMKVTHVMRGDEWIASTPRHVLLYEAFGWEPPQFAHLPVILSPDGGKLSKRKGAASVMDYKNAGYLSEGLFNFLALLGWAPGDDREKMPRAEIARAFSLDRISPKGAVLDEKKLEWMNGQYLQEMSDEELVKQAVPMWTEKGWLSGEGSQDQYLTAVARLMKPRVKRLTELGESPWYFFVDPKEYEEKTAKKHFTSANLVLLKDIRDIMASAAAFDHSSLEELFRAYAEKSGLSAGALIHPTRLAVSGVSFGPGLFELLETLGKERVLRRMDAAILWVQQHADSGTPQ